MKGVYTLGLLVVLTLGVGCASTQEGVLFMEEELYLGLPEVLPTVDDKVAVDDRNDEPTKVIQTVYVPVFEEIQEVNPQHYFDESTLVYTFLDGVVYQIVTAPNYITSIMLEPGERLVSSPAAGDTERWIVGEALSGEGGSERVHLYIKPLMAGLKTNYIITTNKRVYHLDLTSSSSEAMRSIRWSYPKNTISLKRTVPKNYQPTDLRSLQWDYVIEKNSRLSVSWKDIQVARDNSKTYIFFASPFTQQEAPILFASSLDGGSELVNYRVYENCYIVDQVLSAGELRGGAHGERGVSFTKRSTP